MSGRTPARQLWKSYHGSPDHWRLGHYHCNTRSETRTVDAIAITSLFRVLLITFNFHLTVFVTMSELSTAPSPSSQSQQPDPLPDVQHGVIMNKLWPITMVDNHPTTVSLQTLSLWSDGYQSSLLGTEFLVPRWHREATESSLLNHSTEREKGQGRGILEQPRKFFWGKR